jgi:cobalt/nickel transport system ATP-binding protein
MDNNNLLINLEDITFSYPGEAPILKNLYLQLHEGERLGLVGMNGSGKTSLFHVIMGLLKPDYGKIEIFGEKVRAEKDFRSVRQQVGLLFQDADDQLFCPTVIEDVVFGPLNQGKSRKEAQEIAQKTLALLGLEDFEHRVTYKLSGGEQRLVSLATVLAMEPKILLLDEPMAGLDTDIIKKIIGVLEKIDTPYILISHNMDFISDTTTKVLGLVDGRIILGKDKIPHTHMHSHGYGHVPHDHSSDSSSKES